MDDETRAVFSQLDQRLDDLRGSTVAIEHLSKRLDDLRAWGIAILGTAGTLVAVLALVFTWNVNAEKTSLRHFQDDLEERLLGVASSPPNLELLTAEGKTLEGAVLPARTAIDEEGVPTMSFDYVLMNVGGSPTGPMYMKLYTSSEVHLNGGPSSDEPKFAYEAHFPPESNEPSELPAGVSTNWTSTAYLEGSPPAAGAEIDALMKLFYGRKEVRRVRFTLEVSADDGV